MRSPGPRLRSLGTGESIRQIREERIEQVVQPQFPTTKTPVPKREFHHEGHEEHEGDASLGRSRAPGFALPPIFFWIAIPFVAGYSLHIPRIIAREANGYAGKRAFSCKLYPNQGAPRKRRRQRPPQAADAHEGAGLAGIAGRRAVVSLGAGLFPPARAAASRARPGRAIPCPGRVHGVRGPAKNRGRRLAAGRRGRPTAVLATAAGTARYTPP